jgi:putative nucleotidyltransferase with HDIG domain
MEFAAGGEEAMLAVNNREFDAVVTDMRMPGMTGAELLGRIQECSPETVRIILSGQADRESILRSIAPAHQFLSKPCDPDHLRSSLERSLALSDLLKNAPLKYFVSRLNCVPSLPLLYHEVTRELNSEDPSASRLGELIAQDMAMTAKLLQIANSAICSYREEISEPRQAVVLLGMDMIQAMVLSLSIFAAFKPDLLGPIQAERLWKHSLLVSNYAKAIAQSEGVEERALATYQSAGLLHDIGKLIIAAADSKEYSRILNIAATTDADLCLLELDTFGCTHAEVGAYLLGIWGLPNAIVEATAWNHKPSKSPVRSFCPLAAVHAASAFDAQMHPEFKYMDSSIDQEFLERLGLSERQGVWMELCRKVLTEGRPK